MKVQITNKNMDIIEKQNITSGKDYRIIGIEADDIRLQNDQG